MKKVFLMLTLLVFGLTSCGENKAAKDSKKLRVGLNAVFAPFEYKENGQVVGFDVDLINEIAKDLNYETEIIDQSFDGLIPSLKAGKIDVIVSGMTATDDRRKSVDFTNKSIVNTILDLKMGKVDALIMDNVVAIEYMKKNPEMEIFDEKVDNDGMAMAFDKGKNAELIQKINAELKKLKENGKYDELLKKYDLRK